eukprot:TRINITY_DN21336_c0_g1_i1.p4 TRINITY_DN21336_c0_g1~~TRINITY_DN21336_c0_g1_i1.p4  ORF type:complete len:180 (+),score=17.67 TRINITY_DN21336_c0_g1_i1:647-1186(+)
MNLQQMLVQHRCQKDLQQFGRTSFNAVGKIRVSFVDGSVKYCTGTLIGDNTVITSGECVYRENVVIFQFQPSWECDDVWLQFSSVYIPDKWVATNETNNFAIFYLRDPLKNAPRQFLFNILKTDISALEFFFPIYRFKFYLKFTQISTNFFFQCIDFKFQLKNTQISTNIFNFSVLNFN